MKNKILKDIGPAGHRQRLKESSLTTGRAQGYPNDDPASILLERIRQEKARAAVQPKAKKKRKGKR